MVDLIYFRGRFLVLGINVGFQYCLALPQGGDRAIYGFFLAGRIKKCLQERHKGMVMLNTTLICRYSIVAWAL